MSNLYKEFFAYAEEKSMIISTHSHHIPRENTSPLNLKELINNSYVSWMNPIASDMEGIPPGTWFNKIKLNSYFIWLQKGIQAIYGEDLQIDPSSWDETSSRICQHHQSQHGDLKILSEKCKYNHILLDCYTNPGHDNDSPELFTPSFRVNMFLYGYNTYAKDHNGNNPLTIFKHTRHESLQEYVNMVFRSIHSKKAAGCVALKCALSYDRGLDVERVTEQEAKDAYERLGQESVNQSDVKVFQDYIFHQICNASAEYKMPLQIHTGLGKLEKANALQLKPAIEEHPNTKFVLFHGSYPYMGEVAALCHNYKNVYPDLCWLPIISTSAAERFVEEIIEVGRSDQLTWGCDTWTAEESMGARLAAFHTISTVAEKKVGQGYFSKSEARYLIDSVFYDNAKALYDL